MNSISITGRLGQDGEMRYLPNGDAVLGFSVADDFGYGDKKTTNWWRASIFGKRAEALRQYLVKGQQVTIIGSVQLREWTNKDGIKQMSAEVRVNEVALVGGSSDAPQAQTSRQQPARQPEQQQSAMQDDDIPF